MSDLKGLSLDKGEVLGVSLLFTPPPSDAAVPNHHLPATLVEARVEVEGQVIGRTNIHSNPECNRPPMIS